MVMIMIIIVAILSDTSCAERDLSTRRSPVADTLELSRVIIIVPVVAAFGDAHDRTTCRPAMVRDVVVLQLCSDGHIAGEQQTTESEKLFGMHVESKYREF